LVLPVTLAPIGEVSRFAEDPDILAATLEERGRCEVLARMTLLRQAIGYLSRPLTRQFEV